MLAENSCVCVVCWFEHLMVNSLDRHHSLSSKSFSHCGAPAGLLSSFLLILHLLLLSFRKCPFVPLSLISLCSCQLKVRGQQHWARCMLGQLPPDLHTDNNNCKFFFLYYCHPLYSWSFHSDPDRRKTQFKCVFYLCDPNDLNISWKKYCTKV